MRDNWQSCIAARLSMAEVTAPAPSMIELESARHTGQVFDNIGSKQQAVL